MLGWPGLLECLDGSWMLGWYLVAGCLHGSLFPQVSTPFREGKGLVTCWIVFSQVSVSGDGLEPEL